MILSMLANDPLKIPLTRQPVQSAAVRLDVIQVTQPVRTFPTRDHTAQPVFPFRLRKVAQVLAGDVTFSR
jgi:hypothetical protein